MFVLYLSFMAVYLWYDTVSRTHIPIYNTVPMGNKDLTYDSLLCGLHHRCGGCQYLDTMLKIA